MSENPLARQLKESALDLRRNTLLLVVFGEPAAGMSEASRKVTSLIEFALTCRSLVIVNIPRTVATACDW
jgi:hypothetical protein